MDGESRDREFAASDSVRSVIERGKHPVTIRTRIVRRSSHSDPLDGVDGAKDVSVGVSRAIRRRQAPNNVNKKVALALSLGVPRPQQLCQALFPSTCQPNMVWLIW